MNRTKIEWTDFSWNPETGCDHGCWYCYARKLFTRFHKSFRPTFYPERLLELDDLEAPTERNNRSRKPWIVKAFPDRWLIFGCSVADLFARWTPEEWRSSILKTIEECPVKHVLQLLTKNPELIPPEHQFPDNIWVGTTITNENDDWINIGAIKRVRAKTRFVSFEPLLGALPTYPSASLDGIQWIIIGKLTGSRKVKLDPDWVDGILEKANSLHIPVFLKNNLNWPERIQEFPKAP